MVVGVNLNMDFTFGVVLIVSSISVECSHHHRGKGDCTTEKCLWGLYQECQQHAYPVTEYHKGYGAEESERRQTERYHECKDRLSRHAFEYVEEQARSQGKRPSDWLADPANAGFNKDFNFYTIKVPYKKEYFELQIESKFKLPTQLDDGTWIMLDDPYRKPTDSIDSKYLEMKKRIMQDVEDTERLEEQEERQRRRIARNRKEAEEEEEEQNRRKRPTVFKGEIEESDGSKKGWRLFKKKDKVETDAAEPGKSKKGWRPFKKKDKEQLDGEADPARQQRIRNGKSSYDLLKEDVSNGQLGKKIAEAFKFLTDWSWLKKIGRRKQKKEKTEESGEPKKGWQLFKKKEPKEKTEESGEPKKGWRLFKKKEPKGATDAAEPDKSKKGWGLFKKKEPKVKTDAAEPDKSKKGWGLFKKKEPKVKTDAAEPDKSKKGWGLFKKKEPKDKEESSNGQLKKKIVEAFKFLTDWSWLKKIGRGKPKKEKTEESDGSKKGWQLFKKKEPKVKTDAAEPDKSKKGWGLFKKDKEQLDGEVDPKMIMRLQRRAYGRSSYDMVKDEFSNAEVGKNLLSPFQKKKSSTEEQTEEVAA